MSRSPGRVSEAEEVVERLPPLGLGTVQFGLDYGFTRAKTQAEADALLARCAELGFLFLDTARAYGDSEGKIGSFLSRNPARDFVVATKLERVPESLTSDGPGLLEHIRRSAAASLAALGTARLDLLLLHQEEDWLVGNPRFWDAVRRAREEGLFRAFGLSVYDPGPARRALEAAPDAVRFLQVPYNVFDRRFEAMAPELRRLGVRVIGRSAFLKGLIPCPEERLPEWAQGLLPYKRRLKELARSAGIAVGELALRFCLRADLLETTILGADSVLELEENARALAPRPGLEPVCEALRGLEAPDQALVDPRRWQQFGF